MPRVKTTPWCLLIVPVGASSRRALPSGNTSTATPADLVEGARIYRRRQAPSRTAFVVEQEAIHARRRMGELEVPEGAALWIDGEDGHADKVDSTATSGSACPRRDRWQGVLHARKTSSTISSVSVHGIGAVVSVADLVERSDLRGGGRSGATCR